MKARFLSAHIGRGVALIAALGFATAPAQAIIDLEIPADGLDDVWEAYFGAQSVLPGDDEDSDGFTNLEECLGGTNPFDPMSRPHIEEVAGNGSGSTVMFPTVDGKCYQVQISSTMLPGSFQNHGAEMHGTGDMISLTLSPSVDTETTGSATHEVWTGIPGGNVADLTSDPNFPGNPSGVQALGSLKIPINQDDGYGGRIRGFIKPPGTGNYFFYLASRNNSEFWLSTDDTRGNLTKVAFVNSSLVAPDEWNRFSSQASGAITLTAGQKYYFEVIHKHFGQEDHCSVGWDGPGLPAGIEVVDGDYLCPVSGIGIVNPDTTGQVVYYSLDEGTGTTAVDGVVTTTNEDGTLDGGAVWTEGVSGSGVELDGTDDKIDIPDSNDINLAAPAVRTVALWFKADDPGLAAKQVLYEEGGTVNGLNLYLDSGVLYARVFNDQTTTPWDTTLTTPFTDTGWHHVVVELNAPGATGPVANGFRLFLDGAEVDSGDGDILNAHGGDVGIGAVHNDTVFHDGPLSGDGAFFDGCVDEFHLFNRVLTPSEILGLSTNPLGTSGPAPLDAGTSFIRVAVKDLDQDGDGISDYSEKLMSGEGNFSPFDSNSTTSGNDDFTTVSNALGAGGETVTVTTADVVAVEDNRNGNQVNAGTPVANVPRNVARFRINRTGSLQPIAVNINFAPNNNDINVFQYNAEPGDYQAETVDGAPAGTTVMLGFGQVSQQIVINPVHDTDNTPGQQPEGNEFPERVRCNIEPGSYTVGGSGTAVVRINDALDIPEQEILFVGRSAPDPKATQPTQGTAICSGFLNGSKTHMRLNSLIMAGFSSPQNDSHIHKANAGPTGGPIIYEITNVPDDAPSGPKIGEILDYPWEINPAEGGQTGAVIVDSLFGQNGETPMYINWHTNDNQDGELWALLGPEVGSIDAPDAPPAPPAITPLAGADLERDVRRFLDQATFGATDADVYDMITNRIPAAGGDRIAAYGTWIDDQIAMQQSYLVDYTLAADNQEWKLRGFFDPSRWVAAPPQPVPTLPAAWPSITRTNSNAGVGGGNTMVRFPFNNWYPNQNYPLNQSEINWGRNENVYVPYDLLEVNHNNRRRGHWLLMTSGKDQLRQKMGYSLQQIIVVAETLNRIRQNHIAAANYQDAVNHYAFGKFHDLVEWVNWSPIMGKWLSSLKNQKAFDTSVPADGIPDVFPDENLAREDMQLFTIGLFNLWLDGTLRLDEGTGLPQPSYDNIDITEFARVLTGQSFSRYSDVGTQAERQAQWGITAADNGNPFDTDNTNGDSDPEDGDDGLLWNTDFNRAEGNRYYGIQFTYPMRMFGAEHDEGIKTLAGGHVIDNTSTSNLSTRGRNDLQDAINWFAGNLSTPGANFDDVNSHSAVPPFIALRLIQRFTQSNPSSAYLYRVAEAFKNGDGDLEDTIKAILLDYEVRELSQVNDTSGVKRAPLDGYIQVIRNFSQRETAPGVFTTGAYSQLPLTSGDPVYDDGIGTAPVTPPADGFLDNFGWPASQSDNMTIKSHFRYNNTDTALSMTPFAQPTVFNFYLPLYSPGGPVADAGLIAPELQLATETNLIRNINFMWNITWNEGGQGVNTIGGDPGAAGPTYYGPVNGMGDPINPPGPYNQRLLYGATLTDAFNGQTSDIYENVRIEIARWGENIIPWSTTGTNVNSQAAFDDLVALVDAIDLRAMNGWFQTNYPAIDANDDDDPALDGINPGLATTGDTNFTNDTENMTPREIVINALFEMEYNPYNANATTARNAKRDLFRQALYLMSVTPEFWVRK